MTRKRYKVFLMVVFFLAIVVVPPAMAVPIEWDEFSDGGVDAGELLTTGQETIGVNVLDKITGTLPVSLDPTGVLIADVDIYQIFIPVPALFSATTDGFAGGLDTQLFLFNLAGFGIYTNNDAGFGLESTLPTGSPFFTNPPFVSGIYNLAISTEGRNPFSSGGAIFPSSTVPDAVLGPSVLGGSAPLSGWSGPGGTALITYTIVLTGVQVASASSPSPTPVPEPSTFLLLGAGLIGLVMTQGRKRIASVS